jgi:hypothetical protein
VPLFVKYPGQRRGRIDARDAQTIDIVPTIADVLGVKVPWRLDGASLRGRAATGRRVRVTKVNGDPVTAGPAVVSTGVLATARRNASLFGEGADSMFGIGPFTRLLDRPVASLRVRANRRSVVRFDDGLPFDDVRMASGLVPVSIAGEIRGHDVDVGTPLAIAVNGRVRATTSAFDLDGQTRFAAMVPETSFRDGGNSVEVFAVSARAGALGLASLGGTPAAHARVVALSSAEEMAKAGVAEQRR